MGFYWPSLFVYVKLQEVNLNKNIFMKTWPGWIIFTSTWTCYERNTVGNITKLIKKKMLAPGFYAKTITSLYLEVLAWND